MHVCGQKLRDWQLKNLLRIGIFLLTISSKKTIPSLAALMNVKRRSMQPVEWERRQTQPKAKQQTKATHSGNANNAFPEVFRPVFMHVSRCVPIALSKR